MAVIIDASDRILIQGITGRTGRAAANRMAEDGTPLVGGVTPGRGGQTIEGRPVFESVDAARRESGATASFVAVPAMHVADACFEAIEAGLRTIVIYTEHVPLADAIAVSRFARERGTLILGPNSAGCVSPGHANLSDLDSRNLRRGDVGIVSKSGTLTYEVVDGLVALGLGLSSVVCLGGDPIVGTDHARVLTEFERDPETSVVVLMGELGGRSEIDAADVVSQMRTPVVAFIAGRHAPEGKRMGHAGAIAALGTESALAKQERLRAAGATVVQRITDVARAAADARGDARMPA